MKFNFVMHPNYCQPDVMRRHLSEDEFRKLYLGEFSSHDDNACAALHAYEDSCKKYDAMTPPGKPVFIPKGERMEDFARKFGCTVESMKQHWRCIADDGA